MTDRETDTDDRPGSVAEQQRPGRPGVANLLDALSVRRNAAVGLVVGVVVAVTVYVVRVFELLGPPAEQAAYGGPVLFALLAFVLGFGTFVLVAAALTAGSLVRRTREL